MEPLYKRKNVTELYCGANFMYVLSDNTEFNMTEYKVLLNQGSKEFIRCMKLFVNGRKALYYQTNNLLPFTRILPTINPGSFMTIMGYLFNSIITVKSNGFLSCQSIDIAFDKIFVDPSNLQVHLVYMPLLPKEYADDMSFESSLRTSLIKLINGVPNISDSKTLQLAADLSDGRIVLEELYNRIMGKRSTTDNENVQRNQSGELRIVALNAPTHIEILVNKNEFLLGKSVSAVNAAITFNKAISRVHCKILREGNQYVVMDMKSSNGTYINQNRLIPNQPYPLYNGDVLRLANSDFRICIS